MGKQAEYGHKARRERLDLLLVARGLFKTRSQAQAAIRAGEVLVNGQIADKPGMLVGPEAQIELRERPRYVSRGGLKLEHALRAFNIQVQDKVALDIGASTGGFTDCLLKHGARKVYAVDVGYGQLDWRLRQDPRVVVLERVNARYLKPEDLGEQVDLATIDVSFISLRLILPPLREIVKQDGEIIALIKPQFEAGRAQVRKGVIRDPAIHLQVLQDMAQFVTEEGFTLCAATYSPLRGPEGNIEFFFCLRNRPGGTTLGHSELHELVIKAQEQAK